MTIHRLTYTFPNWEPFCCFVSSSNCCFLTCIQISQKAVRWSGIPISFRIFQFVVRVGLSRKLSIEELMLLNCGSKLLEKTLESSLDCMEIQPVHSKGDQSWVFIGRTDAKAETPILWPPHVKS